MFKITGAMKNPLTATDDIGTFILETLINNSEVVDSTKVMYPFDIQPGQLYLSKMLFEPSMNSQENPITKFIFKNQHALVSGSDIKIWVPVSELGGYSTEGVTC